MCLTVDYRETLFLQERPELFALGWKVMLRHGDDGRFRSYYHDTLWHAETPKYASPTFEEVFGEHYVLPHELGEGVIHSYHNKADAMAFAKAYPSERCFVVKVRLIDPVAIGRDANNDWCLASKGAVIESWDSV